MVKGLFVLFKDVVEKVYPNKIRSEIESLVDMVAEPMSSEELEANPEILKDVEVIFSGWGGPNLNKEILDYAPNLKMVFYGAGSIKTIVTDEFWERGIRVTTANYANAVPVAEFTVATAILGLKNAVYMQNLIKETREYPPHPKADVRGLFDANIGLISLGSIGLKVIEIFKSFDINIIANSPSLTEEKAEKLGIQRATVEEIFKTCDVVSLHSPLLESTRGMITGDHFRLMKEFGVFINTARGAIVREDEMIEVLKERKDITAFLDVVDPEPPAKDSPLYEMSNVVLTPHIAGSEGNEIARMGKYMAEELRKYLDGQELEYEVTKAMFERMA